MNSEGLARSNGLELNYLHQAGLSESESAQVESDTVQIDNASLPSGELILITSSLVLFGAIALTRLPDIWKGARSKIEKVRSIQQTPCRNCKYFTNNAYLKCAVRPKTAMTEEAINCPDYCSKTQNQ